MSFELSDEKAIDVLIWWVEGADGSIDYSEEQAVKNALKDINYSLETYYQETLQHIGALGTDQLDQLVDEAVEWGSKHFDHHKKQVTVALLNAIAECNGEVSSAQQEKLDRITNVFGVEAPEE
ncbi:MAG: hypothetical protein PVH63_05490 [Balneolaceae bacterium]|jgi:uncharacterized tellurite resistance protein B-like protein